MQIRTENPSWPNSVRWLRPSPGKKSRRESYPPMNQRNQKKTGFAGERFKKALLFSSHFLVVSGQKSEEFSSFYFANLRFWENKALFYKLFKLRTKRLRKYGVGGIRTLGTL
jgi:hypothetical protein